MPNKRQTTVLAALVFLVLFGWSRLRQMNKQSDAQLVAPVLKADEQEKIIVEPQLHQITVVKRDGTQTLSLPGNRPVAIVQDVGGKLTIQTRFWGTEIQPWIGFGFADEFGISGGLSVFYVGRFDFNVGVTGILTDPLSVRGIAGPSYNLYSNTSILAAMDTSKHFWVQAFWRF